VILCRAVLICLECLSSCVDGKRAALDTVKNFEISYTAKNFDLVRNFDLIVDGSIKFFCCVHLSFG